MCGEIENKTGLKQTKMAADSRRLLRFLFVTQRKVAMQTFK